MKQMSKKIALLCVIILVFSMLCSSHPSDFSEYFDTTFMYNTSFILGKNSDEIQERYGEFDKKGRPANQDGLYYDCACAYYTIKNKNGFTLYRIYFDSNGIAYKINTTIGPKGG